MSEGNVDREWVREKAENLWRDNIFQYFQVKSQEEMIVAFESALIEAMNRVRQEEKNREGKIQDLLRHAFVCTQKTGCNCSERIQEFLTTDQKSLDYATAIKEKIIGGGNGSNRV